MLIIDAFYQVKEVPFYPYLGKSYCEWKLDFVKCFFFSFYRNDHVVFFFCLLLYYINRFSDGKPAFPSWGKPHLECIIFFICCWICMLIFCKKFYIDVHGGYWLVVFIPCDISVLLWYQSNTVFLKISLEVFPPTIIFWK